MDTDDGGWAGRLRLALMMGLAPEAFWRLSLREWRMLTTGSGHGALPQPSPGRADLESMMEMWPDDE